MKKKNILSFLLIMTLGMFVCTVDINAATVSFKKSSTIEEKTLIEGVDYQRISGTSINESGKSQNQKISAVTVSKGSAEIAVWSIYDKSGITGGTVSKIAKDYEKNHPGYKVIAGINADYFAWSNGSFTPTNAVVQDGDVIKYQNHDKYQSIAFNSDGSNLVLSKSNSVTDKYYLTIYDEDNITPIKEVIFNGYNQKPVASGQTSFFYKNATSLNMSGVDLYEITSPDAYFNYASILIKGKITNKATSVTNNPIIATTDNELSELLAKNPYIRIQKMMTKTNENYDNVIGVGSQPLANSKIVSASEVGDQSVSFAKANHPRTSLGFTKDGNIVLAAIDGRQSNSGMVGVTLAEEAAIMQSLGCVDCFNFDGGGSTELIIRSGDSFITTNSPSDGSSRAVSTAVFVVVPDVLVDLDITDVTKTTAKVSYNTVALSSLSDLTSEVVVNGNVVKETGNSFYVTGLKENEANFISVKTTYKLNGQTYSRVFKTKKIYTTAIADSTDIVKVKPNNFKVTFERTTSGFDAIITCDDPSQTLKKVYLVNGDEKEIAIKDIRGYVVSFPITSSVDLTFEIKYEYNLGTMKNESAVYEEKFAYQYTVEPTDILVNFNLNTKKKGFDLVISYNDNGCALEKIIVTYDDKTVESTTNTVTIENATEKAYDLTVKIVYNENGQQHTLEVPGSYMYIYHAPNGCTLFNYIDFISIFTVLALVVLVIRRH